MRLFLIFGLIWFGYFAFQFPCMPSLLVPSSSLLKILFPETMSQGERLERRLFWQISVVPLVLVSYFGAKYVSIINLKQHYSFKFLILDLIWFFKARLVRNSSWSYVLPLLVILSIHPIFCFPPIYMVSTSCTVIYIILNLQVINYIQWWVFIITWGSIQ